MKTFNILTILSAPILAITLHAGFAEDVINLVRKDQSKFCGKGMSFLVLTIRSYDGAECGKPVGAALARAACTGFADFESSKCAALATKMNFHKHNVDYAKRELEKNKAQTCSLVAKILPGSGAELCSLITKNIENQPPPVLKPVVAQPAVPKPVAQPSMGPFYTCEKLQEHIKKYGVGSEVYRIALFPERAKNGLIFTIFTPEVEAAHSARAGEVPLLYVPFGTMNLDDEVRGKPFVIDVNKGNIKLQLNLDPASFHKENNMCFLTTKKV